MENKNKREIKDAAAADLARRAEEILRQNPSTLSERMKNVATPAEILEAVANLRIHEIELEMQNEELRRTQMQLTASNIRYFDLYELAPVGYITVNENGQILRANLTATSQLGMARDQLTTQRFSRFILKADQDIFYLLRRQLIKTREPQTCELRMLNKDGSPFWAKLEASAELAEAGEKQEIILRIVLVDISELKDKEQELRDSHWRMESIIEGTQLGTWEWNIQTGETVFNEQWAQTIGYTLEELAPISIKTWEKFVHPDDLQQSDELLKRYFAGELPTYYSESRMRHKDGRWVWVLDRGRVFTHSADGKPLMMFGTHADITERKLAEEALRESNERFRNMFEKNSAVMLLIDPHTGTILDANRSAESFYGYDKQKLITMSINDFNTLSPDQIATERQKALTREKNYFIFTHKLASGEKRAVEVHSTPIIFQDKQILFSIIHDITERKLAEEALRESEEKYRTVADFTHDWEAWRGPDNTYLYVSPSCERISGHTAAEFQADPDLIVQITHPDDKSIVMAHYKSTANESQSEDLEFDFRIHTPDGETRWIAHSCTAVYAADGKWLGRRESNRDMTERKLAEEALRESEEKYRLSELELKEAQAIAHVGSWKWEIETNEVSWSDEMFRIFGIDKNSYRGRLADAIAKVVHPEDLHIVQPSNAPLIAEKTPIEYRIVLPDGSIRFIWAQAGDSVVDQEGKPVFIVGTAQDITERKQMEEALRQNEEKYRTVADFAYDWEAWRGPDNTYLYVSPSCERISGYTAAEFLADPDLIVQITHPDDKSIVMAHYQSTANQSERADLEFDFRILTPDGETRWIAHSCTAVYAADGKWLGRRDSNREITERKKMGEALEVEKEILVKLLSVSEDFLGNSETEIDYQKLCDNLLLITGAQYSIFNMYEENGRDFQTLGISGLNENIQKASAMFGFDLIGKRWAYDEKRAAKIQGNDITRLAALSDLTESGISKPLIALMEKLFNLGELVLVKILVNGKALGDFTLVMAGGKRFTADNPVSIYARQVGLLIQRKQAEAKLLHAQEELKESYLREQQLASIDGLTGINNHRSLLKLAEREFDVAMRYKPPLSMMFFDIDNFKQINDTFGHAVGDEALKNTIQAVCGKLRSADQIGRYGGDEFVILLPQTSAQDALPLAERIHASIAAMRLDTDRGALTLTISIGIAQSIHDALQADTVEALLHRSDIALYAAKQAGKNCTRIHDEATLMKE